MADEDFELEFDEDDVEYYIVDEDDNEIGVALRAADGTVTEYWYADGDADAAADDDADDDAADDDAEGDAAEQEGTDAPSAQNGGKKAPDPEVLVTRDEVSNATKDMNDIYKSGATVAREFKGVYDDIASCLDFGDAFDFLKKPTARPKPGRPPMGH